MRARLIGLLAVAVLVGCGGGDGGSGPSTPVDVAGTWSFSANVSNGALQLSCNASGTIVFAQVGDQASGTYQDTSTCTGPGGSIQNSYTGTVGGGKITGSKVSFTDDEGCKYTGSASGNPTNFMSGSVSCTFGYQGSNYKFSGSWNANR